MLLFNSIARLIRITSLFRETHNVVWGPGRDKGTNAEQARKKNTCNRSVPILQCVRIESLCRTSRMSPKMRAYCMSGCTALKARQKR